jgi:fluoroacetyl-CoA thioesterase
MSMDTSKILEPGLSKEMEFTVEEKHAASYIGSGSVRVLATPIMILFIEVTARTLIEEYLPETHTSVGTLVNVRHLTASPVGSAVRTEVTIEAVEGNKIILAVSAWEGDKKIGEGTHERYVVEKERFLQQIEQTN